MINFYDKVITIFNFVPTAQGSAEFGSCFKTVIKSAHFSSLTSAGNEGVMKADGTETSVYIKDISKYLPPHFGYGGFYNENVAKADCWTANIGDLVVFSEALDDVPNSFIEWKKLKDKYKVTGGGVISSAPSLLKRYFEDGTPFLINHLEFVCGGK